MKEIRITIATAVLGLLTGLLLAVETSNLWCLTAGLPAVLGQLFLALSPIRDDEMRRFLVVSRIRRQIQKKKWRVLILNVNDDQREMILNEVHKADTSIKTKRLDMWTDFKSLYEGVIEKPKQQASRYFRYEAKEEKTLVLYNLARFFEFIFSGLDGSVKSRVEIIKDKEKHLSGILNEYLENKNTHIIVFSSGCIGIRGDGNGYDFIRELSSIPSCIRISCPDHRNLLETVIMDHLPLRDYRHRRGEVVENGKKQ